MIHFTKYKIVDLLYLYLCLYIFVSVLCQYFLAILSVFLSFFALRLYFELAVFAMSTDWETVWFEQRLKVVGLANSFWSVLKSGTHIDFSLFTIA